MSVLGLRQQLPVYSPIRFSSLVAGTLGSLGLGRPRQKLIEWLSRRYGTPEVLLLDSGTSALRLAIEAALADDVGAHDAVALPAYCCYDVVTAAVGAGARIHFYDVDPHTFGPDWASLEASLAAGVAAVVVVHLYGIPVDMDRICRLASAHGVLVIEDAAQGFGGRIGETSLGAIGSLGVLSFGRGKGITGGGGGALLANDEAGRRALDEVRGRPGSGRRGWGDVTRLAAQWLFGRPSVYGLPASLPWLGLGRTHFKPPWRPRGIGRGSAAAVLANRAASEREATVRRENATELAARLRTDPAGFTPVRTSVLRFPILAGTTARSEELLVREGVARGYPETLASVLQRVTGQSSSSSHPGATRLAAELVTAPVHSRSTPARVAEILGVEPERAG